MRRGSRQGNKRQRDQAKRRKKQDKEARRAARKEEGTEGVVEVVDAKAFIEAQGRPLEEEGSDDEEAEER